MHQLGFSSPLRDAVEGDPILRKYEPNQQYPDRRRCPMKAILFSIVVGFNYFVGFYFGLVNAVYSILLAIALIVILRHIRRIRYAPFGTWRAVRRCRL
jgi:hypothetical protein